jgi:hypothetical protein
MNSRGAPTLGRKHRETTIRTLRSTSLEVRWNTGRLNEPFPSEYSATPDFYRLSFTVPSESVSF